MKRLILLPALLFITTLAFAQDNIRYAINGNSSMEVHGGSTIHDWKAFVNKVSGFVHVQAEQGTITRIDSATLTVATSDMDCKNGTMNSKMREALKAKEHPSITYSFVSAQQTADGWLTSGNLTVAGTSRPIDSSVTISVNENGELVIAGSFEMSMEVFNMKAPTAMMGAVKTHDKLRIEFTLNGDSSSIRAQK